MTEPYTYDNGKRIPATLTEMLAHYDRFVEAGHVATRSDFVPWMADIITLLRADADALRSRLTLTDEERAVIHDSEDALSRVEDGYQAFYPADMRAVLAIVRRLTATSADADSGEAGTP